MRDDGLMCRLAAYLGKEIPLSCLISEPNHSLYKQSWQAQEMSYAELNADGFGFGWYGKQKKAGVYRNAAPIWADSNLGDLATALRAKLWLAMVRSATPGCSYSARASQPFKHKNFLFMHNGFIDNMGGIRKKLAGLLSSDSMALIAGVSDSEYLFALFCEQLKKTGDIRSALRQTLMWCADNFSSSNVSMLNIIVSDGKKLCASRFAIHEKGPSLYLNCKKEPGFPEGSCLLASERFSKSGNWKPLPANSLLTIRGRDSIESSALC